MPKLSAGILLYRKNDGRLEVFLVHPGGPFWKNKDLGAWSIPKGEYEVGEDPRTAAQREFEEETGHALPEGELVPLSEIKQPSGKLVRAWAIEGDCSVDIRSNMFSLEWPPRSGKTEEFPEVDRAGWFEIADARAKLLLGQHGFLDQLATIHGYSENEPRAESAHVDSPKQRSLFE
jgi:predicted NUDIX family NTP pyrophosphohydrolase